MSHPTCRSKVLGLALLGGAIATHAFELPEAVLVRTEGAGTLLRFEHVEPARALPRTVDVWLPPGLEAGRRCAVLYAHDGQNLFDPATSYIGVDWGLDETLAELIGTGELPPVIVVAPWNTSARWPEYMPVALFERLTPREKRRLRKKGLDGAPCSEEYLAFLAEELKPAIDARFPTRPEREATFLLGSSMGGLVSLAALCERPETFGGAACLSTHWPAGAGHEADWLRNALPVAGSARLWMDHGDRTLDADYGTLQPAVDAVLLERRWRPGLDWESVVYPGHEHSERSWRERLPDALFWLFATPAREGIATGTGRSTDDSPDGTATDR